MLPLLKKKPEPAPALQVLPWHPNFRNYERLPDIKVVSTAFFVNVAAITLTIAIAAYVGFESYSLLSINSDIAVVVAQSDRDKPSSDKAIGMFRKFQAEDKRLQEIDEFLKSRPAVSPVLMHLGQTLPKNVALSLFDMRDKGLTLRAFVRGAPKVAGDTAEAYRKQLKNDKVLSELFEDVTTINMTKNPQDGRLIIELYLKFKTPAAAKK